MVILTKYLVSTMLRNQLIVLMTLFLVFFSQRFVRVLNLVFDGNIPKFLIFIFFVLGVPEIMKLILPVSLFIGILMTFNYLHFNNEVIAMYSCGVGNGLIFRGVLFLSSIIMVVSIINVLFLSPFCLRYQSQLMLRYQSDVDMLKFFSRKFQCIKRMNSVFFIEKVCGNNFDGVFFVQRPSFNNHSSSVVIADHGYIEQFTDGALWIILNSGHYYFWNRDIVLYPNFYVSYFNQYKIFLGHNKHYSSRIHSGDLVTEMFMNRLWRTSTLEARVELHSRLTLIFMVVIMVLIIFPLSLIRLNNNYLLNIFPSVILYLLFFLLQIFLRSYIVRGYIDLIWIWIVNFFYVLIAMLLNFWDSVIFRNVRWKLKLIYMNYRG